MILGKSIPVYKMGDLNEMFSKSPSFLKYEEQARKMRDLFGNASGNRWVVFRRKEVLWVAWHPPGIEVQQPHLARTKKVRAWGIVREGIWGEASLQRFWNGNEGVEPQ